MRVHSGLPIPIPRPRRFRPRYRDVSRSAEIRGSVLSEVGGLKMVATLTASWTATADLGYRDRLADVPP